MLGLSGIGWMFISLTFGYVVHEIINAVASVAGEEYALSQRKITTLMFSLGGLSMFIYPIIGIFLGPKWYIAPMFALGAFLISGRILHRATGLLIRNPHTLLNVVYPLFALVQFVSACFAFIAWF